MNKYHQQLTRFFFIIVLVSITSVSFSQDNDSVYLKIALLQMRSEYDSAWTFNKAEEFCRIAKEKGADIALFPEMIQHGYYGVDFEKPNPVKALKEMAVSQNSPFVNHFRALAKELEMAIVITYLEERPNESLPRNSASLIDMHGNIVFTYTKVHTCDFGKMERSTIPGDDFYVESLDTKAGPVNIGMMICYDREAPESARILMLKGAEIILTPNACDLFDLRLDQFKTRAFENAVVTAMTNYGWADENTRFNGHSCIFNADGKQILMCDEQEGVFVGTINLTEIREYRRSTVWGDAYRRPHKYSKIIGEDVQEIFMRKDGFGNDFNRTKR